MFVLLGIFLHAQKLEFPEDFEVKADFFQKLEKYKWEKDAEKMGIYTNPVNVTHHDAIKEIAPNFYDLGINAIYLEVKNVSEKSSVLIKVIQFKNKLNADKNFLELLQNETNVTNLFTDNYLIGIELKGSDKGNKDLQKKLIKYYQKTVNAKLIDKAKLKEKKTFEPVLEETTSAE